MQSLAVATSCRVLLAAGRLGKDVLLNVVGVACVGVEQTFLGQV